MVLNLTEKRKRTFLIILAAFIGVTYIVKSHMSQVELTKQNYYAFYKADINDALVKIKRTSTGTHITIKNGEKYTFWPFRSALNNHNAFIDMAEEGDYIVKPSFSDILILKKNNGHEFRYRFEKIILNF